MSPLNPEMPASPSSKKTFRTRISVPGLTEGVAWGLAMASLTGVLGQISWLFDPMSHFIPHYFIGALMLTVLFGVQRRIVPTGVFAGLAVVHLIILQPHLFPSTRPPERSGAPQLRVLWWNLQSNNARLPEAIEFLSKRGADVIALGEVTPNMLSNLGPLETSHPYSIKEPRSDPFGIALYSRYPIFEPEVLAFGPDELPTLEGQLLIEGQVVRIQATHAVPPIGFRGIRQRNAQLRWLAQRFDSNRLPTILLGDLNTTPWSQTFRQFIDRSGLVNQPPGFFPTWPAPLSPVGLPIDHCLVTASLRVHSKQTGPPLGSDHSPIIINVGW